MIKTKLPKKENKEIRQEITPVIIDKEKEFEKEIDKEGKDLLDLGEEKIERRGRKKGSKNKSSIDKDLKPEDLKIPIAMLLMNLKGKWKAEEKEANNIELYIDNWINKRFPILKIASPEIGLLLAVSEYVLPRMFIKEKIVTTEEIEQRSIETKNKIEKEIKN